MSKTILITGSTDGIGKLAAIKLAKEGHSVYIHGRNSEKVSAVLKEIKEEAGMDAKGYIADFSDLNQVAKMAEDIKNENLKLDILINNAGVFKGPESNKDGLDLRIVVNYLATYLLTKKLLSSMNKGGRIINLGSIAQAPVSFDVISGKEKADQMTSYSQSKLAIIMFSFFLSQNQNDVSVVAVNPGSLLNTKMAQEAFGRSFSGPEKGADILYDLAVSIDDVNGKYYDNDKGEFSDAYPDAYDEKKVSELITFTKDFLKDY